MDYWVDYPMEPILSRKVRWVIDFSFFSVFFFFNLVTGVRSLAMVDQTKKNTLPLTFLSPWSIGFRPQTPSTGHEAKLNLI